MNILKLLLITGLLAATQIASAADVLYGRVVGVTDGDTITILDNKNRQHEIRLFAIDAPETSCHIKKPSPADDVCVEKSQPFGKASKKNLSYLVYGKNVKVLLGQGTSYNRIVGTVFVGNQDINLQQVRDGYAWHYTYFAKNQPYAVRKVYEESQKLAKKEMRGLWGDKYPVAPWDYRKGQRTSYGQ
jgi:endonuclease YncB( thermonuclease family)